ncbi:DUF998 domain-containing protein [Kitasatospora sp. NPDC048239]|uniref:DUF998 domain-containing protein n=1 Tax=Kitasatospora sp. NPDC048239 TaxID=3364046 RepID=UPI0037102D24
MPSPRPGRRSARSAVAALLLLSAVAYTAWVLEVVLSTGLDPVQAYVSELAAEDQPLGGLFRATDLVAGLAAIAAFEAGHGTWSLGAGQRLQVLLVALWLALLALSVARPGGAADAPAGERAEGGRRETV